MEPHNHPDHEQTFSRVATILERLATYVEAIDKKLEQHIHEDKERDAETTDKLNALIDLLDRHLREHEKGDPQG